MNIALINYRAASKNYLSVREGDVICTVLDKKGWALGYVEGNAQKYGFIPKNHLRQIR